MSGDHERLDAPPPGGPTGERRASPLSSIGSRMLRRLLAAMEALGHKPDLVTLAIGANDMLRRTPPNRLHATLSSVLDRLPPGAVVATLPQGLGRTRPVKVNRFLDQATTDRGLVVADLWGHTGPPWSGKFAADGFHPNDTGYRDWVTAFTEALDGRWS